MAPEQVPTTLISRASSSVEGAGGAMGRSPARGRGKITWGHQVALGPDGNPFVGIITESYLS